MLHSELEASLAWAIVRFLSQKRWGEGNRLMGRDKGHFGLALGDSLQCTSCWKGFCLHCWALCIHRSNWNLEQGSGLSEFLAQIGDRSKT